MTDRITAKRLFATAATVALLALATPLAQAASATGGGGGASGSARGKYETFYLPGDRNGGPSVTEQGPMGQPVQVTSGTFRQMLPQYSSAAQASLGRTALPPALQQAVKRYFQALGQ